MEAVKDKVLDEEVVEGVILAYSIRFVIFL